eukprot:jgi/Botrbrau1/7894/Bobra.9_2s0067.1
MSVKPSILHLKGQSQSDGFQESLLEAVMSRPEKGAFDCVFLELTPSDISTLSELAKHCLRCLKPGGKLTVRVSETLDNVVAGQVVMHLLVAGFLNPEEEEEAGTRTEWNATTPTFEIGAKVPINLKTTTPSSKQTWTLAPDIDDADLIDEDDLLTEEDRSVRPVVNCGPSTTKKACKNCSCGRAEAEAAGVKQKLTKEMIENPQSNCGSCGLGDAFRCAGCPYRGLPSWKPGEKIQLPSDFLLADV